MVARPMSQEFYDWLDKCPYQWFKDTNDDGEPTYSFTEEVEN